MNRSSGFTIIEVMITVAVIALLAAIAIPNYQSHLSRGRRAAAKSAMMDIATREQQFLMANRTYADKTMLTNNGYVLTDDVSKYYDWDVAVDNAGSPPSFTITLTPTGAQANDGELTLDSTGNKTPADKWNR